jgi:peptide/nickel transport system substrate-binding protein
VAPGLIMANTVFDPLAAYAEDGSVKPYLPEKIEPNGDFTAWTIKLRPGITFSNGEPLNADAVVLFFQKLKASPLTAPVLDLVDTNNPATKVDDLTARVNMTAPWTQFPVVLTGQGGMLPAPAQLNNPDANFRADNPIGTGPFKLKSRAKEQSTVVSRNDGYWRKDQAGQALPYLEEVEFKFYNDNDARDEALINGDVNMEFNSFATSAKKLTDLAQQGKFQLVRDTGPQEQIFLVMNMDKPPFDDVRIRQALAYATDRDRYVEVGKDDPSWISYNVFSPTSKWYQETPFPHYDPAKAKELVAEYVKEKGEVPAFTIKTTDTPANQAVGQALVDMYKAVGLPASAESVSIATLPTQMVFGQYDVGYVRLFGAPDPDGDYYWFTSKNAARLGEGRLGLNLAKLRDPQIDAALDRARTTTDENVRKQAYKEFQTRLNELVPYVWLTVGVKFIAADNRVRGITNGPLPDGTPSMPVVSGVTRLTQTWMT